MLILSAFATACLLAVLSLLAPGLTRGAHAGRIGAGLGLLLALHSVSKALALAGTSADIAPRVVVVCLLLLPAVLMQLTVALRNVETQRHHLILFCWVGCGFLASFAATGDALFTGIVEQAWGWQAMPGDLAPLALVWSGAVLGAALIDSSLHLLSGQDGAERRDAALAAILVVLFGSVLVDWAVMLDPPQAPWGHVGGLIAFIVLLLVLRRVGGPVAIEILLGQGTLDRARDGLVVFDGRGRIQRVNRAALSVLGRGRRMILGSTVSRVFGLDLDHYAALADLAPPGAVERQRLPDSTREIELQPLILRDDADGSVLAGLLRIRFAAGPARSDAGRALLDARSFELLLARELRLRAGGGGPPGAVLMITVEGREQVAQRHGEQAYAELRRAIAERLQLVCDWSVDIAELRNGIYAVLLIGLADESEVASIADHAAQLLREPWPLGDTSVTLAGHVGVVPELRLYHDVAELMADAESVLEMARRGEGGEPVSLPGKGRTDAAINIEAAIQGNGLELEFLPVIHLRDQEVAGVRVSVRWAPLGIQPLDTEAIRRLARRSHVAGQLRRWLVEQALDALLSWGEGARDRLHLWLPLGMDDVLDPELPAQLRAALDARKLDPRALIIAVSATDLDQPGVRGALARLAGKGIRAHLGGFSQSSRAAITAQGVKAYSGSVDPDLVAAVGNDDPARLLMNGLHLTARALSLRLLAEGVSSHRQLAGLIDAEVELAQGPHLSGILDAEGVRAWLAAARNMKKLFSAAGH